jgi:hypothetical protein
MIKNHQTMRERVEELISDQLPSRLFEAMLIQHKRHGHKNCLCDYCRQKRTLSHKPAFWHGRPHYDREIEVWLRKKRALDEIGDREL